jgi:hypothetical protein
VTRLVSSISGAAIALSLMSAAPALAKTVSHTGPTNPTSSTDLAAKPKGPVKKIVKTVYNPDGTIKSRTVCTGTGQQYCN